MKKPYVLLGSYKYVKVLRLCVHRDTYIIVENMFWLECSWQKHHGVHQVKTYKEIVDLLIDEYDADEAHTLEYDSLKTVGMNDTQFFAYLEESGRFLS